MPTRSAAIVRIVARMVPRGCDSAVRAENGLAPRTPAKEEPTNRAADRQAIVTPEVVMRRAGQDGSTVTAPKMLVRAGVAGIIAGTVRLPRTGGIGITPAGLAPPAGVNIIAITTGGGT